MVRLSSRGTGGRAAAGASEKRTSALVRLDEALAVDAALVGDKAARLARLQQLRAAPVPAGLCLTVEAEALHLRNCELQAAAAEAMELLAAGRPYRRQVALLRAALAEHDAHVPGLEGAFGLGEKLAVRCSPIGRGG